MSAKDAIKAVVDGATDQQLVALFAALAHPDKAAMGTHFAGLCTDMATQIEYKVGLPKEDK